jgi:hypothetical protein
MDCDGFPRRPVGRQEAGNLIRLWKPVLRRDHA